MPCVRGKNGTPLYVYDPNPLGCEAIVLLHGWPLNHEMFEYQLNMLLDENYRCIVPDLRGFGRSGAPVGDYGYDTYADDLAAIVKQLGVECFILCGFSMGGAIALRYMKRYCGRGVKKLVCMAAAAPVFTRRMDFPYGTPRQDVDAMIALCEQNRPLLLENFSQLFLQESTDEPFRNWCNLMNLEGSPIGTRKCLYSLRDEDLRDDTRFVHVPCGIFHGLLDRVCPYELGVQLHEMIPFSTLFTFACSGHCIFHDELEAFNSALLDFIRRSW